jgi:ribosomal protein S18 acetylase RimI-like enzyme
MRGMELIRFDRAHLPGAIELFESVEWETYTEDPERTFRALTAPGCTTLFAVNGDQVVALIQIQSDGEIQAHLSNLLVAEEWRGQGIGSALVREGLERAGGLRLDVMTRNGGYYRSLGADSVPGFRLRPADLE